MAVPVFSRPAQSRERSPGSPRRPVHRLNSSAGQSGALVKRRSRVRIPLQARGTSHETSSGLGSRTGAGYAGTHGPAWRQQSFADVVPSYAVRPCADGGPCLEDGARYSIRAAPGGGSIPPSGTNPPDGFSFNDTVPPWASRPGGTPAPVAQRIERRFPKAGVAGSSPAGGTLSATAEERTTAGEGVGDHGLRTHNPVMAALTRRKTHAGAHSPHAPDGSAPSQGTSPQRLLLHKPSRRRLRARAGHQPL